jgi:uncharacterized protein
MALRSALSYFRHVVPLSVWALAVSMASASAQTYPDGVTAPETATVPPTATLPQAHPVPNPAISRQEKAKQLANEKTITIMGAGRQAGYTQFAEDIANVLEKVRGNPLRVVPVLGRGSGSNVIDMLQRKNIDVAIVDRDVIEYLKKKDPILYGDVDKKIDYIAKISNAELHIYARNDIKTLENLRGKKISCLKEGSTAAIMCENLFQALKIDVEIVYDDADVAWQKVKSGEIAAAVRSAAPPLVGFEKIKTGDNLHFVPISEESLPGVDFTQLRSLYLPGRLRHEEYPNMIPDGEEIPTIATSSLLVVYAWPSGSQRYKQLQKFVTLFFDNIDTFRSAPNHPGWGDINLAAEVPGWTRFPAAKVWLDAKRKQAGKAPAKPLPPEKLAPSTDVAVAPVDPEMRVAFDKFLDDFAKAGGSSETDEQKRELYAQFLKWWEKKKQQP